MKYGAVVQNRVVTMRAKRTTTGKTVKGAQVLKKQEQAQVAQPVQPVQPVNVQAASPAPTKVESARVNELKDRIMQEMRGTAPQQKTHVNTTDRVLLVLLLLGIVVILGLLVFRPDIETQKNAASQTSAPSYPAETPADVTQTLLKAYQNDAQEVLVRHIDLPALTANLTDQFYGDAQLNTADLPPALQNRVPDAADDMLHPGLQNRLQQQIQAFLEGTTFTALEDGLFKRIWRDLSQGQPLELVRVAAAEVRQDTATVTAIYETSARPQPFMLQHIFARQPNGAWRLIDLPNLKDVVETTPALKPLKPELLPAQILDVQSVSKQAITRDGAPYIEFALSVRNQTQAPLEGFTVQLKIFDAAGQLLTLYTLEDSTGMTPGETYQRSWAFPVNAHARLEQRIRRLPLDAFVVETFVQDVQPRKADDAM